MKTDFSRGHRARVAWGVALLALAALPVSFAATLDAFSYKGALDRQATETPMTGRLEVGRDTAAIQPASQLVRIGGSAVGLPMEGSLDASQVGLLLEPSLSEAADAADRLRRSFEARPVRCPQQANVPMTVTRALRPMSAFLAQDIDVEVVVDAWLKSAGLRAMADGKRHACGMHDPTGRRVLADAGVLPTRSL